MLPDHAPGMTQYCSQLSRGDAESETKNGAVGMMCHVSCSQAVPTSKATYNQAKGQCDCTALWATALHTAIVVHSCIRTLSVAKAVCNDGLLSHRSRH